MRSPPRSITRMLSGDRSRWTIPREARYSIPCAAWTRSGSVSVHGLPAYEVSGAPSRYSIASHGRPVLLADLEERHDVHVEEALEDRGLAVEAHARLALVDRGLVAGGLGLADDLQRHEAAVALVDGLVHDPHPAAADPLQDPVVGDPLDGAGQGPRQRPVPAAAGRRKMFAGSPLTRSIFEANARKTPSPAICRTTTRTSVTSVRFRPRMFVNSSSEK